MKKTVLFFLIVLSLTGCATSVKYVPYTDQKLLPKSKYYFVTVYPEGQNLPATPPYYVVGKVVLSGYLSDGVTADELSDQAKKIARKKGADAIINAKTERIRYNGVVVEPGFFSPHHYHPPEYIPYSNVLVTFRGELVSFGPTSR